MRVLVFMALGGLGLRFGTQTSRRRSSSRSSSSSSSRRRRLDSGSGMGFNNRFYKKKAPGVGARTDLGCLFLWVKV